MTTVQRSTRIRRLITLALAGGIAIACGQGTETARSGLAVAEGIPAPGSTLTDGSSVPAFFQYGDSLRFAADTPGVVTVNRVVGGVDAALRVRSEVRLPWTDSAAYVRGRIIAKYETLRASSPYNTPVGNAYLWVQDTGGGHFRGVLLWRNYITGDTGRTMVPYYAHSSARAFRREVADCVDLSSAVGDTIRVCCLCSDGRFNCPMTEMLSTQALDELLTVSRRFRP